MTAVQPDKDFICYSAAIILTALINGNCNAVLAGRPNAFAGTKDIAANAVAYAVALQEALANYLNNADALARCQ